MTTQPSYNHRFSFLHCSGSSDGNRLVCFSSVHLV